MNQASTYLATFRSVAKKDPRKAASEILDEQPAFAVGRETREEIEGARPSAIFGV